jgi:transposase-like protein
VKRWTTRRKVEVVKTYLRGEVTAEALRLADGITAEELEAWVEGHQRGGENALKQRRISLHRQAHGR